MPAPRMLPTSDVLRSLRNKGKSYEEIAQMYGVTKGAVYWQLRDAGLAKKRPDYKRLIPWTVKAEHAHARPVVMLRLLGRRQNGDQLPEVKARMLDKWLTEVAKADVVVCYSRTMPPNPASPSAGGFYYSRRRPEDGESLIRVNDGHEDDSDSEKVQHSNSR